MVVQYILKLYDVNEDFESKRWNYIPNIAKLSLDFESNV